MQIHEMNVVPFVQRLENFRIQLLKAQLKWAEFLYQARTIQGVSVDCNVTCAKGCFSNWNNYTPDRSSLSIFANCLAPLCGCMRPYFYDIEDYEDLLEMKHPNPEFRGLLNNSRIAHDKEVDEFEKMLMPPYKLSSCDLTCHEGCLGLKEEMPFDVLMQCVRYHCNCWYRIGKPIFKQPEFVDELDTCDVSCTSTCASATKDKQATLDCIAHQCGCIAFTDMEDQRNYLKMLGELKQ